MLGIIGLVAYALIGAGFYTHQGSLIVGGLFIGVMVGLLQGAK